MQNHILFIVFETAYDDINCRKLYNAMLEMKIRKKLVSMEALTMVDLRCTIQVQEYFQGPFPINNC